MLSHAPADIPQHGRSRGIDYYQSWLVGNSLATDNARDVYSETKRRTLAEAGARLAARSGDVKLMDASTFRVTLETYPTPWLFTVLQLGASDDYAWSLSRYRLVCLGAFVTAVLLLGFSLQLSVEFNLVALLALLRWFEPLHSDLRVANVACLQLAALAIALVLCRSSEGRFPSSARMVLVGVWCGLIITFKPNLVLASLFLVVDRSLFGPRRTWMALLFGQSVGVAAACLVAAWTFGSFAVWPEFWRSLGNMSRSTQTLAHGNVALGEVATWDLLRAHGTLFCVSFLGLATGLAFWIRRRLLGRDWISRDNSTHHIAAVLALGSALPLLAYRLAWVHYFVLLVPCLMYASAQAEARGADRWAALVVGTLAWVLSGLNVSAWLGTPYTSRVYGVCHLTAAFALCLLLLVTYRLPSKTNKAAGSTA